MDTPIVKAPICFTPYLKKVIWGGDKICRYKGIARTADNIGESWEVSAIPGHVSVVESGIYAGETLTGLIDRFGAQLLGDKVYERYNGEFPLLVKLIDANDNLSVQVHPDDRLARQRHNGLGKAEMWYIIATENDAKIYPGLNREISPEEYEAKVNDGTFSDVLAIHESKPGDVFYLPAGRVHSIGAGNLLAEIQESSDITYRIFDYNRTDASGKTRELHTEFAKDAIDYTFRNDYRSEVPDETVEDAELLSCPHFNVRRVIVSRPLHLSFDPASFTVMMCVEGEVTLKYESGSMTLRKGHSVLLPAVMTEIAVEGSGRLLTARVSI